MLPDVIAGIISIISLMVLLRFWKPKSVWRFKNEPPPTVTVKGTYSKGQILKAWSPFIVLTLVILTWGLKPVRDALDSIGSVQFNFPWLNNTIINGNDGSLIAQVYKFNYLSASGTAILISALISIPITGMKLKDGVKIFFQTLNQLKFPIITIASVLGFAYIINNSGISLTLAKTMANTGVLFPFFAPILGWLGVFITGSDTSSNALFAKLQGVTASTINVNPVVTVAANCSGGVMGKMISPQSIAVGAAAVGLVGKESDLFRFTLKHSFILLFVVCLITIIQAYLVTWVIPTYEIVKPSSAALAADVSSGYLYLGCLVFLLFLIILTLRFLNKKRIRIV